MTGILTRHVRILMIEIKSGKLEIDRVLRDGLIELLRCRKECRSSGIELFESSVFSTYDSRFCDLIAKIQKTYPDFDTSHYEAVYDRVFALKRMDVIPGYRNGLHIDDEDPEREKSIRAGLGKLYNGRRDSEKPPTREIYW